MPPARKLGFAVSPGARRLALLVAWVIGAVLVVMGILGAVWPQGVALLGADGDSHIRYLLVSGYLWPLLPVAWLVALVAVAVPPVATAWRRWPAYLALGALGLLAGAVALWWIVEPLVTGLSAEVYGPRSHSAADARLWLCCALTAASIATVACGILVAAGVRQHAAAAGRAASAPGSGGFSARAAAVATCVAAGALVAASVSWLRVGRAFPSWYGYAALWGIDDRAVAAILSFLVAAGWLVPVVVFGVKARRTPTAAWIAAGAAGSLLVYRSLSAAVSDVRWYRSISAQLGTLSSHPASQQHVAWTTLMTALIDMAVNVGFGVALLIAAVAQYRAWRAVESRQGRAPWRAAGIAAAALTAIVLVAPLIMPLRDVGATMPDISTPAPSASATQTDVAVTPAPAPSDGLPTVVGVEPAPGSLSGWSGDELRVGLQVEEGEVVDDPRCQVWLDGKLADADVTVTYTFPGDSAELVATFWPPADGSTHSFLVQIVTRAGGRLSCGWVR
jgi:hypothetical protein